MEAFFSGFGTSLSLILAIGAQNAFVLKQGILKQNVFIICLICAISDAVLIFGGILGLGYIIEKFPAIKQVAIYGGFCFLFCYGIKSFYTAFKLKHALNFDDKPTHGVRKTILLTLAFTWLNPHVYLDTMLLIGSVSAGFGNKNLIFGYGAACASFVFFFTLGYASRLLSVLFKKPLSWKILEIFVGILMIFLAFVLLFTDI
ncbi:LysE/ArgO family amino acid transporter [Campylobacter mucosalis]|uniref:Transporter, LysE family n=1 Tax=Campylobacter mucosalis CCUG 21559 TaxID=1032067 RepID=A0A6G5QJ42_9BACT|nr:LysE/ArgO family amino acid transporter [Campylobacter mucosalis]QCD45506.1 transporter, LysE family [Campylobacter mucosalis CCUG 21559]